MLTLLHISDLHFGPPYRADIGAALLAIAPRLEADLIVASGDFTQRARPEQFAAAREFLDRLPRLPTVVVPGNHDIPLYRVGERLFAPYALYRQYICPELDTVLRREDAVIVALNTTDPLRAITNGRIKPWQLDFCAEGFRDRPHGAAKIVVAHHHFAPAPDYDRRSDRTAGVKAALDRFTDLGVDLVLGGHLHRAYIGNSLDVYRQQRPHPRDHHRPVRHLDLAAGPGPGAGKELVQPDQDRRRRGPDHALHALSRDRRLRPGQPAHLSPPQPALFRRSSRRGMKSAPAFSPRAHANLTCLS